MKPRSDLPRAAAADKVAASGVFGRRWFLAVAIRSAPPAPSKRSARSRAGEARAA